MPLLPIQREIARLLAVNRTPESHLAGGAGLHLGANSVRYSNDLDYFNDREELVASAFEKDRAALQSAGFAIEPELNQPGYIRAIVSREGEGTKIEWAYESAFRFLPPMRDAEVGYVLHPIDLAINKVHALAGRDEARDFIDVLFVHEHGLPLGALCWAAVGKDPGFSPESLLEQLARKGRFRPEDFGDLQLAFPLDLPAWKRRWCQALDEARQLIARLPPDDAGCLYMDPDLKQFVAPAGEVARYMRHFGSKGGVLPAIVGADSLMKDWPANSP